MRFHLQFNLYTSMMHTKPLRLNIFNTNQQNLISSKYLIIQYFHFINSCKMLSPRVRKNNKVAWNIYLIYQIWNVNQAKIGIKSFSRFRNDQLPIILWASFVMVMIFKELRVFWNLYSAYNDIDNDVISKDLLQTLISGHCKYTKIVVFIYMYNKSCLHC